MWLLISVYHFSGKKARKLTKKGEKKPPRNRAGGWLGWMESNHHGVSQSHVSCH